MRWIVVLVLALVAGFGSWFLIELNHQRVLGQKLKLCGELGAALAAYAREHQQQWPDDMNMVNEATDGVIDRIERTWDKPIDEVFVFFPEARRGKDHLLVERELHLVVHADGTVGNL
jgi:hypothetical protein